MSDTTQTNAMAEIALALAMGFFSIMVLTMVSMGSGLVVQDARSLQDDPISIAKTQEKPDTPSAKGRSETIAPDELVIFHNGVFFDNKLIPLTIASINARAKVILAVSPDLSMSQTMQARDQISAANITVVVLNESWVSAIKEAKL